jgi:diguanylate cyclase (GGDEF)-like protein
MKFLQKAFKKTFRKEHSGGNPTRQPRQDEDLTRLLFRSEFGWRRRAVVLFVPFGMALVLMWTALFLFLGNERASVIEEATGSARTLAQTLEQRTLRKVQQIDLLTQIAQREFEQNPDRFNLASSALPPSMFSTDIAIQATIIDANGHVIQSTTPGSVGIDLGDREHFLVHKKNPGEGLFISKPVIGRLSHQWSIQFTRRLSRADGTFAGVVVLSVNPAFFTEGVYDFQKIGRSGLTAVASTRAYLLSARVNARAVGMPGDSMPSYDVVSSGNNSTLLHDLDAEPLYISALRVADYPLYVVVGLSRDSVFAAYQREARICLGGLVAISALLLIGYGVLLLMLQRLYVQARVDWLTGLPNLRYATELIEAERRKPSVLHELALFYIDLDDFGRINDRFNHCAGDEVIKLLASRFRVAVETLGTVARIGGDEFVVVTTAQPVRRSITQIMRGLESVFKQPFSLQGNTVFISASVGVCIYSNATDTAEILLSKADAAMLEAKKMPQASSSRIREQTYTDTLDASYERERSFDNSLYAGLHAHQFFVAYQPVVLLETGMPDGQEALPYWQHPKQGIMMPCDFMPFAECRHVIKSIDNFVLGEVCQQLGQRRHGVLPVTVKLSGRYFGTNYVVEDIQARLEKHQIPPGLLRIAVSEKHLSDPLAHVFGQLQRLKQLGVQIILDDFGAGHTSLIDLWKLPINGIRIDGRLLHEHGLLPATERLFDMIVSTAAGFSYFVVVQGVDTADQAEWLKRYPGIHGQGNYFCEPVTEPVMRLNDSPD